MVFIQRSTQLEMPKDAIILTPSQALEYQRQNINSLDTKENWPLIHGRRVMGVLSGLQAGYIMSRFRRKLKLQNFGMFSLTIPFVAGPIVLTSLYQNKFVSAPLILQNECSICVMTRSVFINTMAGNVLPALGGGLMALWYGHNVGTYTLPPREWKYLPKFFSHVLSLSKPLVPIYYGFLALNIISSSAMVALQENAMQNIHKILAEKDLKLAEDIYLREKRKRKYTV